VVLDAVPPELGHRSALINVVASNVTMCVASNVPSSGARFGKMSARVSTELGARFICHDPSDVRRGVRFHQRRRWGQISRKGISSKQAGKNTTLKGSRYIFLPDSLYTHIDMTQCHALIPHVRSPQLANSAFCTTHPSYVPHGTNVPHYTHGTRHTNGLGTLSSEPTSIPSHPSPLQNPYSVSKNRERKYRQLARSTYRCHISQPVLI
jgi:hypothetical protein